jgi:hypothetical protein
MMFQSPDECFMHSAEYGKQEFSKQRAHNFNESNAICKLLSGLTFHSPHTATTFIIII